MSEIQTGWPSTSPANETSKSRTARTPSLVTSFDSCEGDQGALFDCVMDLADGSRA